MSAQLSAEEGEKACAAGLQHKKSLHQEAESVAMMIVLAERPSAVAGLHAANGLRVPFWRSSWISAGRKQASDPCWMDNRLTFYLSCVASCAVFLCSGRLDSL